MLSIMEMVIVIYRLGSERKYLFINFIDMFVIAFINIGIVETLSGIEFSFENPIALFLNIFFALFPIVLVGGLLRSIKWGMISGNIIFVIIAIINHYFYIFRNQPFELVDFLMANTALTILDSYVFEMDYKILFLILIELGIICYFSLCGREKSNRKELYALIILGILIVITGIAYSPALNYWDMEVCVKENGYINTFVAYAKNDFFHDKPEEYSIFEVKNILENYSVEQKGETAEEYPNIIVIMNEAFSDLPDTYGFETSEDSMPYIHSLNENTIKGNILVSIFGGNTANTEYEFLTGNTMAFMGGRDVPYMQFVKREQVNSLVYELKSLNYQTIAFHPCIPQNYNRDKVYPLLGFDEFVSQNNELAYNENIRAWMSDRADFNNVIDIFEHRDKQKPFFLFNVTMQNHGGYSTYQSDIDITVKPIKEEYQYMQLMEYLSLIKETDAAFEEFINYFENVDEKTIILMFGDHQPGLNADVYDALNYGKETATQQTYTVPFIMWANYEIESRDNVLTSPNYLRTMLLKTGEIPLSCYDQFLLECYNQYPAINKLGYYDNNGNCYTISETLPKRLRDYQVLQYANVFDKTATKYFDIWNN